jgi:hypothetical protein
MYQHYRKSTFNDNRDRSSQTKLSTKPQTTQPNVATTTKGFQKQYLYEGKTISANTVNANQNIDRKEPMAEAGKDKGT